MPSLYDLSADYDQVLYMLDDPEADERMIIDTCDAIEGAIDDKLGAYGKIIANLKAQAAGYKAEKDRLALRQKTLENSVARMKSIAEAALRTTGRTKVATNLFTFSIVKNGGKLALDIHGEVPKDFEVVSVSPDMDKIRAALVAGASLNFANLLPRGEHLSIR